jgi:hypothetical protein
LHSPTTNTNNNNNNSTTNNNNNNNPIPTTTTPQALSPDDDIDRKFAPLPHAQPPSAQHISKAERITWGKRCFDAMASNTVSSVLQFIAVYECPIGVQALSQYVKEPRASADGNSLTVSQRIEWATRCRDAIASKQVRGSRQFVRDFHCPISHTTLCKYMKAIPSPNTMHGNAIPKHERTEWALRCYRALLEGKVQNISTFIQHAKCPVAEATLQRYISIIARTGEAQFRRNFTRPSFDQSLYTTNPPGSTTTSTTTAATTTTPPPTTTTTTSSSSMMMNDYDYDYDDDNYEQDQDRDHEHDNNNQTDSDDDRVGKHQPRRLKHQLKQQQQQQQQQQRRYSHRNRYKPNSKTTKIVIPTRVLWQRLRKTYAIEPMNLIALQAPRIVGNNRIVCNDRDSGSTTESDPEQSDDDVINNLNNLNNRQLEMGDDGSTTEEEEEPSYTIDAEYYANADSDDGASSDM